MKSRSLAIAILLGLFLGPVGLLYGSFRWAIIMTIVLIIAGLIPLLQLSQILFPLCWLACPYISVWSILKD